MGTALGFNEEARACYIAQRLALAGYGVLWDPDKPNVVMTSGEMPEVKELVESNQGTVDDWWKEEKVDIGNRKSRE